MGALIILSAALPIIAGALLLLSLTAERRCAKGPAREAAEPSDQKLRVLHLQVLGVLSISALLAMIAAWSGEHEITLFELIRCV